MSKKSGQSASMSSAKSGLNPNTPTYNPTSFRWQSTYMPVGHQLALPPTTGPPPGLWTPIGAPITAGYGYGYPFVTPSMSRFAPPPPVPPHSNYCCLNQRHQCGAGYEHNCNGGWPTSGPNNCWNNTHNDCHNNNNTNGVAITEVKDDSKEESEDESIDSEINDHKKMRELKQTNEELKTSLEETKQKLKKTEETLLKVCHRY